MVEFLAFMKTKKFWLHLSLASFSALFTLWILFQFMSLYTNHNEIVEVPDFKGKSLLQLEEFIKDKEVNYRIIDSIYNPDEEPGIVLSQEPEVGSTVKKQRTIYLYVTSLLPPQILMPKLIDRSLRQATSMIESYGLKLGSINYVEDPCINCIIKQFADGKIIEPGTPIKKNTRIDLEVGKGNSNTEMENLKELDLIGLSYCEAKSKITSMGIKFQNIIADEEIEDSCAAFVYKQGTLNGSSGIDVYISVSKSKFESLKELKESSNNEN